MPSTDNQFDSGGTVPAEPEISAEIIAQALARLGFRFDPASTEDVARAARYVDSVLADQVRTDELVAALDAVSTLPAGSPVLPEASSPAKPFVPMRIFAKRTPADADLLDDAPSRGRLLSALERDAIRSAESGDSRRHMPWINWPADRVQGGHGRIADHIAFDIHSIEKQAPDIPQLHAFISLALKALPEIRPSLLDRVRLMFAHDAPPRVETFVYYYTRNSGAVRIQYGERRWNLTYVAGGDSLLILQGHDWAESSLLTHAKNDDPAIFSNRLVSAFEGHADYARVALSSVQRAIDESAAGVAAPF